MERTGPVSVPEARAEIRDDLFCQECGYNLRGLFSDRCPECGYSLDAVRSEVSRLPWVYRADLGRRRAYWRTVWRVMFQHKRFCEEMARPVDYGDAQRFRWVTLLHVYLPILAATLLWYALDWLKPFRDSDVNQAFQAVWPVAVFHVCLLFFLVVATGVPSYFYHPRDIPVQQQNRAIAMSYYACAALAWTPLPLAILLVGLMVLHIHKFTGEALLMMAICLPFGQLFAYVADLIHVGVRVMPQRRGRLALLAVALPLVWLALAGLIFFGLPLLGFCFVLLFIGLS